MEIRRSPCSQPAAAGAPRTQPRSGRNPRGPRGVPERGRPARGSYAPARAEQISTARASVWPLRSGRPHSFGCGFAALYYNPAEFLRAAMIFHAAPTPSPLRHLPSPLPHIPQPNSAASPRRRRRAPAARSSVSFCARRTKAVGKFRALLPHPALRPGTGRAPAVAVLPRGAAPHLRQHQQFPAPRLRCCRCGRDGRAPLGLRRCRPVLITSLWSKNSVRLNRHGLLMAWRQKKAAPVSRSGLVGAHHEGELTLRAPRRSGGTRSPCGDKLTSSSLPAWRPCAFPRWQLARRRGGRRGRGRASSSHRSGPRDDRT